jgi:hypothetical protein
MFNTGLIAYGMKLGTIVTACDSNPLYSDFIPSFIQCWSHLVPEADIHILYIAESLPPSLAPYSQYIRLLQPLPGMHTAFQAQCIRLLYPREVTRDEGVLITDMDMLPMNRSYYVDSIRGISDSAFVVYRDVCLPSEISMCYNVAHPATWRSLFGNTPTGTLLQEWYGPTGYDGTHGGTGWNTDQLILVRAFNEWTGPKIILNDQITKFARLDRAMPMDLWERERHRIRSLLLQGYFADYHCLRPYKEFRELNDWVVSCLQENRNGKQ